MNLQSDFISPATTNNTSTTNATNNQAPSINISINNGIDSTASYLSGSLISTSRNNKSGANLTNLAANNNNSVSSYHSPLTISSLSSTSSSSSSSSSSPSAYIIPVNAALTSATTTSRPTYITINNLNNTSAINSVQPQQQLQRQQQQQLGTNNQQTTQSQSSSPSSASSPCSSSVSYPSETPSNSSANYCMNSAVGSSSSSSNNTNPVVGSLNSSSNNSNTANKLLAQQIVELLRRLNIRLVAFDFDYTIVTIHTGGQWLDSPEKLAEFVRPCFRDLLPVLLKTPDLNVCVVTYSPQERLIREVLRISLKDEHDVNDLVNKMVIKGNTKEFLERHGIEQCYANGKQVHIQYCRNHFQQQQQQSKNMVATLPNPNNVNKIDAANVLLIDDDIQNIHLASVNGHYAFPVENNMKLPDLYRFLKEQLESYI